MRTKLFLGISTIILLALFMSFNSPSIKIEPDGGLISKNVILTDGGLLNLYDVGIYSLDWHWKYGEEESIISKSPYGFERTDLPSTPLIIRSYEKTPYDFEVLKAYSFSHLSADYFKRRFFTFENPRFWYHNHQSDIINSMSPAPFTKETFKNYYDLLKYGGAEQINFFHLLMQSKISRNAIYKYFTDAFNSLQYNLPSSLKEDLKNQIFSLKVFLKNFPSRKSELLRYEKDNTILDKISSWEAFAYRRITHDKIPISEITEFLASIEKLIDVENSKHLKLFQIQINNGDIILSDTTNRSVVISSNNCTKRIVLPYYENIQVKMFSEADKNYYQFERKTAINLETSRHETQFLGLYSSYLETIRPPDE